MEDAVVGLTDAEFYVKFTWSSELEALQMDKVTFLLHLGPRDKKITFSDGSFVKFNRKAEPVAYP